MDDSTRVTLVRIVVDDGDPDSISEPCPREALTEEQAVALWWWSVTYGAADVRWEA